MADKRFEELNDDFIRIDKNRIRNDQISSYEIIPELWFEGKFNLRLFADGDKKIFPNFNEEESKEVIDFLDKHTVQ